MDLNHLRLLAGVNENLSVEDYQIFLEAEKIKKGAFHKWLGKSEDEPITDADVARGLKSEDAHVRKMAQFAKNMRESVEIVAEDTTADKDDLRSQGHKFGVSAGKSKIDRKEFDEKLHNHPHYKKGGTLATVFGRGAIAGWLEAREGEGVEESVEDALSDLLEDKVAKVATLDKEPNDTDQMEFDKERKGIDKVEGIKVKVPSEVKLSISKRLEELKSSIETYDQKGYDDKSVKQNAVEALEKLRDHLNTGNQESYQQAQIFYGTLMSPIQDMLPARLVRFLHSKQ